MTATRIHAFCNDVLDHHDGVALGALVRRREISPREVLEAAVERARRVNPALQAIAHEAFEQPVSAPELDPQAPFPGVPFFVKDNVDVAGLPTRHGSRAVQALPAREHEATTRQMLAQGFSVIGKSQLPEFGFSPSTEFEAWEPTRNPWNPAYSSGASSGGAAALVAAGVVPIAHGNDGGGSIRIPASCCGLVGLKPTRGRLIDGSAARMLPVKIASEGVVTRTVRDTAHFFAAAERYYRNPKLPPVGLVEGPSAKRLRVALVLDSINDNRSCDETRAVVTRVAHVLERLGHRVEPLTPNVPDFFQEDFKLYWGLIAYGLCRMGRRMFPGFEPDKLDNLTQGLARYFEARMWRAPVAIARLQASSLMYAWELRRFDVVLSPVVSHAVPKLGYLSPRVHFDDLFARILKFTAFTPLNNATGSPAIAVPAGFSSKGLPIGVHFSAAHGQERLLLELAYALEAELKVPPIYARAA